MIENANNSREPITFAEFNDFKKYIGVASVNVVAVNPDNDKLRKYGWTVPEDAKEPVYSSTDKNGRPYARLRFLVQIQDMEDKPIIPIEFFLRPSVLVNKAGDKCKIIDAYGRTAWATKEDVKAKKVPQYANGAANISPQYKMCHPGEEELVLFLMKYLNVTPLQIFDREKQNWVPTKTPGKLTIDKWEELCNGDVSEIAEYLSMFPDNKVKVVFGINTNEDNRSFQTFLRTTYIGNGATPDRATGEYLSARKAIDKLDEHTPGTFSAEPVREWKEQASEVEDNSGKMFDNDGNFIADTTSEDEDLPF